MKKLIVLFMLVSNAALANSWGVVSTSESYLCSNLEGDTTMSLFMRSDWTDVEPGGNFEAWDSRAVYEISIQTTELPFPSYKSLGWAHQADSLISFTAEKLDHGQVISLSFYGDELYNEPIVVSYGDLGATSFNCETLDDVNARQPE